MSNRFRPPSPQSIATRRDADEMYALALQTMRTVRDLCRDQPADANTVLAMAYLTHCRDLGLDRAHINHTLDTLLAPAPPGELPS